jgi:hypothetical protein
MPASSAPQFPGTAASYPPCALLPHPTAGSPLPPHPAASRSHPASVSSPFFPPPWITGAPPPSPECASQAALVVLKFHMGWSRGSVQQSFCVGAAPQKLFFVRHKIKGGAMFEFFRRLFHRTSEANSSPTEAASRRKVKRRYIRLSVSTNTAVVPTDQVINPTAFINCPSTRLYSTAQGNGGKR